MSKIFEVTLPANEPTLDIRTFASELTVSLNGLTTDDDLTDDIKNNLTISLARQIIDAVKLEIETDVPNCCCTYKAKVKVVFNDEKKESR